MPKVMDEVATVVAANGRSANVLAGRTYERAPFNGYVTFYSTGSAAGLEENIVVGGQAITGGPSPVNTQNRSPVMPDDLRIAEVPVYQGQLIQIQVNNTTAGSLTHRLRMEIEG
jgi:hypothetical protein